MILREALLEDIPQMHEVRTSVLENRLSDPTLVTYDHYVSYITQRGKGWVYEIDGAIAGFAIADLMDDNIWALFVNPEFEKRGIGKKLQLAMLKWYFDQGKQKVWLSTSPGTRAEGFYRNSGWIEVGIMSKNEIKFELTSEDWLKGWKEL